MYNRMVETICAASYRRPWRWLLVALAMSAVAVYQLRELRLDTDLKRLLPKSSPAVVWSKKLEGVVGDGGYFTLLFEGENRQKLIEGVQAAAARVRALDNVLSVEAHYPLDFVERYRYLLIPEEYLRTILDLVIEWEAEFSPFLVNLQEPGPRSEKGVSEAAREDRVERLMARYGHLSQYHESPDRRVMGMIVRPRHGVTRLGAVRALHDELVAIGKEVASKRALWSGVSGNLATRVAEFDQILSDLRYTGSVAALAILTTLALAFRSVRVIPIALTPLVMGLLCAFALVPHVLGDLNLITSFLLMVLFGMGVDHAIHLVKRYQQELSTQSTYDALVETFRSTGRSVLTAGLTTALALAVLVFSAFRAFSEFGLIGAGATLIVLAAMGLVLPATLTVGVRLGFIRAAPPTVVLNGGRLTPRPLVTALAVAVLAGACLLVPRLRFDFDFSAAGITPPGLAEVKAKQRKVFPEVSAPAAVYLAPDLATLDAALAVLREAKAERAQDPVLGRVTSIRDYAPTAEQTETRVNLIREIQEHLDAGWIGKVEAPDKQRWLEDFRDYAVPGAPPDIETIPPTLMRSLQARDGSSGYLFMVHNLPGRAKEGRLSMAFTRELYSLEMPPGVQGPTGDKPVLAEILWLVTSEGPRFVFFTFVGVFVLVWRDRQSCRQAFWVLMPLLSGFLLTLGLMAGLGWQINFFNMVVLPALLGMGVDLGVHYYRRWVELGNDTAATQRELLGPLTSCTATTMMGYAGMTLASHSGLQTIGNVAVLGLACCWATAIVLLPGFLQLRERRMLRKLSAHSPQPNASPLRNTVS